MEEYFRELNKRKSNLGLEALKKNALLNKVPIISDEGLEFLLLIIRLTKAKKILEIGTAIGYSAINMALLNTSIKVDTLERKEAMVIEAHENIKKFKLEGQISVICCDALEYNEENLASDYDLIFIDAAKAQYIKFFEKYEKRLKPQGVIVSDNLLFHDLVLRKEKIESKNVRNLVEKIKTYNEWLSKNKKYRTVFLNIGDGMAVSEKL